MSAGRGERHTDDPLIDNSILSRIAAGDAEALAFARRRRGYLSITPTMQHEFVAGHSIDEFARVASQFHITILPDVTVSEVQLLASSLGISSPRRMNDLSLLAAAARHGVGLVTADRDLLSAALRQGHADTEFRIFQGTAQARWAVY